MTGLSQLHTPQAEDTPVVQCSYGHLMLLETAQETGRRNHTRLGCPYCLHPPSDRQAFLRDRRSRSTGSHTTGRGRR